MKVRNAVMRNRARSRAQSNWQRLGKGVRGNVSV